MKVDDSSLASQGPTQKVGWLLKMGGKIGTTWCQRWIVVQNGLLSYYKTPQDEDPCGVIPLENSSLRFVEDKEGGIEIFTQYRKYYFMARNGIEASEWIEAIQHARTQASREEGNSEDARMASFHILNDALEKFSDTGFPREPPQPKGNIRTSSTGL